jgi:hypothetical protein
MIPMLLTLMAAQMLAVKTDWLIWAGATGLSRNNGLMRAEHGQRCWSCYCWSADYMFPRGWASGICPYESAARTAREFDRVCTSSWISLFWTLDMGMLAWSV